MEKQKMTISFSGISKSFRDLSSGSIDTNMMWRIHLSLMLVSAIGVALFAYTTYSWAVSDEVQQAPLLSGRDTQTITELGEVVTLYRAKEKDYQSLLKTAPVAPSYEVGKGVVVPRSLEIVEDVPSKVAIPSATTSTSAPMLPQNVMN